MAIYGRHGVLSGQSLDLRVVFTDDTDCLVNPDITPVVYIYDESIDEDTIETELAAAIFTSALAGPLTPTQIATGFYELEYIVPTGSAEGDWHDVWVSQVDGVASEQVFEFVVEVGAVLTTQILYNNELIIIELDSSIANLLGDKTLGIDTQVSFSTLYSPLYASPDLVRLEVGPWISFIPDDTMALMIHWSSKEADFIAKPSRANQEDFEFARTKFVIYDAALKALNLPGASALSGLDYGGSGGSKALGDLSIKKNPVSTIGTTSSGIDLETLKELRRMRDEWWRVVNAGGEIVPGQGFKPTSAVKGSMLEGRRVTGRLWEDPGEYNYLQPSTNSKVLRRGAWRARFGFSNKRRR